MLGNAGVYESEDEARSFGFAKIAGDGLHGGSCRQQCRLRFGRPDLVEDLDDIVGTGSEAAQAPQRPHGTAR